MILTGLYLVSNEPMARLLLKERAMGRCEGCGKANPTDWSHRLDRSHGGGWTPWNGLHLCRRCHTWAHAEPTLASIAGWRLVRLPDGAEVWEVPVWLRTSNGVGWWLLNLDGGTTWVDPDEYGLPERPQLPEWVP